MKILVIEDDLVTAAFIGKGLKEAGFTTYHADEGNRGLELALSRHFDAAIIDIKLPGLDGLSLIKKLRDKNRSLPILILSIMNTVDDRVNGLLKGGDDYLIKPFALQELLARIHALIRRSQFTPEVQELRVSDLRLDIPSRKVFRGDTEIVLQPREFALLECLLRKKGRVTTRTVLLEDVWDYHFDPETNVVEAGICRLREKVDRPFDKNLIHTIHGTGYVLEER